MAMITVQSAKRRERAKTREDVLPATAQRPAPPYFFSHFPNGWTFDAVHGFLPRLCKHVAIPGVNGAYYDERTREVKLGRVKQGVTAKGGTVINPLDKRLIRDGETEDSAEFYDYVRFYDRADGKRHYIEPGQIPTITTRGQVIWNTEESHKVSLEFRAHLRDAGIVEALHHVEYVALRKAATDKIDQIRSRLAINPGLSHKLVAAEKHLAAMVAEWEKLASADAKASKAARKPRRARTIRKETPDA